MLELAMLFNVSGLIQEGIGATRRHQIETAVATEGRDPERVRGEVEFLRTKTGVLVRAWLELVDPELCSRCLQPLEETLRLEFEEEFQATVDPRSGYALPSPPDPDAFLINSQHELDLTDAIRQYREVAAIMQPLCRPDCRGLCQRCGADLNAGPCNCESSSIDVRWAGLAEILREVAVDSPAMEGVRTSEGKE
jgi:uncharacterized protein